MLEEVDVGSCLCWKMLMLEDVDVRSMKRFLHGTVLKLGDCCKHSRRLEVPHVVPGRDLDYSQNLNHYIHGPPCLKTMPRNRVSVLLGMLFLFPKDMYIDFICNRSIPFIHVNPGFNHP